MAETPEPVFLSSITAHSWSKDHKQIALSPNSHLVWIYDTPKEDPSTWTLAHTLSEHFMTVTGIDWNHETNMIVTSGQDRNAYVWTFADGQWKPTLVILRIGRSATCAKWSPNGKKFAVGSGSKQIPVCHYEASQDMWVAKMIKKGPKSTVMSVDWSPDGCFVIAGGSDFKCRIFSGYIDEVDSDCTINSTMAANFGEDKCKTFGNILIEFDQSRGWVETARFSPSGLRFAFAGHDSTVHFGDLSTGKSEVQTILRRDLPLRSIAFLDDNLAVGAGYDNVPIVYELKGSSWEEVGPLDTGKAAEKLKSKKKGAFSSAKSRFAAADKLGGEGETDVALPFRHQNMINDIIVYAKGKFTTSSVDGRVLHWDMSKKATY
jgi:actin related protein 2/3 complex subunit 1A/1B